MKARGLLAAALLVLTACVNDPLWRTTPVPSASYVTRVFAEDDHGIREDDRAEDVPLVPVRRRLRPCCAFGSDIGVRVGLLAVPGIAIGNLRSADDIGHHSYDSGRARDGHSAGREKNGLVYTCRGGFIDTAHVRDYVDWTLFLSTLIGRALETGVVFEFADDEGGRRRLVLEPVDPELVRTNGRRELAIGMAQWAAYQLSLWHEIATWYGWSSFEAFSERASAFSPEDVYSNVVGIKMAGPVIWQGTAFSEDTYNAAVDQWIDQALHYLGALDRAYAVRAAESVDQLWWDSNARLPDARLVLRRNIQGGSTVWPWTVPTDRLDETLRGAIETECEGSAEPQPLRVASRVPGLDFERVLRFEVDLSPQLVAQESLSRSGTRVTQSDFPRVLEVIRSLSRQEFGLDADSRTGGGDVRVRRD
jgi:hypothetical protein